MKNKEMETNEKTEKIIGACMEVHRELGCGFLEKVYQAALEKELQLRGIPYEREKRFAVMYKGESLNEEYIADFVCYGDVILELKAVSDLCEAHKSQVLNYLSATGLKIGLLVNFGEKSLRVKRLIN